jgi:hypothetical protein
MKKDDSRDEQQGRPQRLRQQQQHDEDDGDENGPTVATNTMTTTAVNSNNINAEGSCGNEEFVNYGTLRFVTDMINRSSSLAKRHIIYGFFLLFCLRVLCSFLVTNERTNERIHDA